MEAGKCGRDWDEKCEKKLKNSKISACADRGKDEDDERWNAGGTP